jgi:hypothetical protein
MTAFARRAWWGLALMFGRLFPLSLRLLGHRSEILQIPSSKGAVRIVYSDGTGDPDFHEWTALQRQIVSSALLLLSKTHFKSDGYGYGMDTICVERGRRGKTCLLGKTLVWFPPGNMASDEAARLLAHDVVWLHYRNYCWFKQSMTVSDSRDQATVFTKKVLEQFGPAPGQCGSVA